jgi:hypothetical protein
MRSPSAGFATMLSDTMLSDTMLTELCLAAPRVAAGTWQLTTLARDLVTRSRCAGRDETAHVRRERALTTLRPQPGTPRPTVVSPELSEVRRVWHHR